MPSKAKKDKHITDILGDASYLASSAALLTRHSDRWARTVGSETHLRSISVYPPSASRNGQWLVIGKAWSGGYRLVAFHRSTHFLVALVGFFQRYVDNSLVWKPDEYAEGSFSERHNPPAES